MTATADQARAQAHYTGLAMEALVAPKRRHGDAKAVGAHTPGPWSVNTLYADLEIRGPAESGVLVAVIPPWGIAAEAPDATRHNARLIAAAPDLLEAGIGAAGALQGAADALRMSGHPRTADKLLEMTLPLLAALKKATVPA